MILGIGSFTYGWSVGLDSGNPRLCAFELLKRAAGHGLNCVQIGDNLPLHDLSESKLNDLKAAALKNNIRLEVGARKLTENHLQHYLAICKSLKAPLLRFVVDGDGYEPPAETIISILKNAVSDLKQNGITLGIENHDRFKAKELAAIIEAIAEDGVGICLDCVNSIGAGEGLEWVADRLAPYTVNLHVKDFSIKRIEHKMGFTVMGAPAGDGMMDLPYVMSKLQPFNRCQSAILEQWVTPESDPDLTIKKEILWADRGINYLKHLPYFKEKK